MLQTEVCHIVFYGCLQLASFLFLAAAFASKVGGGLLQNELSTMLLSLDEDQSMALQDGRFAAVYPMRHLKVRILQVDVLVQQLHNRLNFDVSAFFYVSSMNLG